MSRALKVVRDSAAVEIDPAVDEQYQKTFGSQPRSLKIQKEFDARMQDAANFAIWHNPDILIGARKHLARVLCDLFAGTVEIHTADLMLEKALENYNTVMLHKIYLAGSENPAKLKGLPGISAGEAQKVAGAHVVGQESTERVRALNDAFADTFREKRQRQGLRERIWSFTGFVAMYVRPSHLLLENYEDATDIPHAEAMYGSYAQQDFINTFDSIVDTTRSENRPPDIYGFLETAFRKVTGMDIELEADATKRAIQQVQ